MGARRSDEDIRDGATRGSRVEAAADTPSSSPRGAFARCFVASVLSMTVSLLFNGPLSASVDPLDPWARDWATACSALALLALLAVARTRPQAIRPRAFTTGAVALSVGGYLACALGVAAGHALPAVAGLCAANVAGCWLSVVWLLACSGLSPARACVCLAGASCLGILAGRALSDMGGVTLACAVDVASALGIAALCAPLTHDFFRRLRQAGAPANQEVAHPGAFLPLRSHLFVYIFAFSLAYGFGLRCVSAGSADLQDAMACLLMLAACGFTALTRRHLRMDAIFVACFALVLFGYQFALIGQGAAGALAPALLVSGSVCFELLMWSALCSAARRNAIDAIPTVAWGFAVDNAGILAGAVLAMASGADAGAGGAKLVVATLLGALALYVTCTRRTFGFDETIAGIAPDAPAVEVRDVDMLESKVARVAEASGLTPRERDVMALLARGNNARHIEEELSITHNTVKYHARNVYAKLGVHSQQELIDLVAAAR